MRVAVDPQEEIVGALRRLGRPDEQVTAGPERKVERLDDALLNRSVEVDQQVAARDQIQVRERRILDHVVMRKQQPLAELAPHVILGADSLEKPLQTFLRHIRDFGFGIKSLARDGDRFFVEVRREHLNARLFSRLRQVFGQHHGNRVRFFSGRAARHPHAHLIRATLALEQARDDAILERLPGRGIAEEVRHADQELLHQRDGLVRVLSYELRVLRHIVKAAQVNPPIDATLERRRLVVRKIVAGAHAKQRQHVPEPLVVGGAQ
jgi:hypothetical protein